MKNLIMDIKHILSGYNFFNDKYLRNIDFARESFAAALKKARQYYDGKSPIKTSPELVHDSWMKNIQRCPVRNLHLAGATFCGFRFLYGQYFFHGIQ